MSFIHRVVREWNRAPVVAAAALALLLVASSAAGEELKEAEKAPVDARPASAHAIPWAKSFAEAREAAAREGKPLLVDFEAEWCGYCKKLDRETFMDERVIRLVRERFVAVKVDVDREPDLPKKFEVSNLPTILCLSAGGDVLQRIEGFRPPERFLAEIGKSAESSSSFEKLKTLAAESPADPGAQRAYARALVGAKNLEGAVKVLRAALETSKEGTARAGILLDLGDTFRSAGKNADARKVYEEVIALEGAAPQETRRKAFVPLAHVLLRLEEPTAAVETLDRALREVEPAEAIESRTPVKDPPEPPGSPEALAAAGRRDAALDRIEALFLRAYAHSIRKDAEKAIADLRATKEADPEGPWGLEAERILDVIEAR
ncbi:MAG TPA: thioredoxin family protein [Planctomycetota bacterium]|nr:thioredoxin family protein [Planctomycetota bacterium]